MRFDRAAALAAALTLLTAVSATARPIATTAETNLRKGPGTDSEVLTLIPKGTTVEIGKCSKGWCEAGLNEQSGFVIARNVGMAPRRARFRPQVYDEDVVAPAYGPRLAYRPYPYFYRPSEIYGYPHYGWGWGWRRWY